MSDNREECDARRDVDADSSDQQMASDSTGQEQPCAGQMRMRWFAVASPRAARWDTDEVGIGPKKAADRPNALAAPSRLRYG